MNLKASFLKKKFLIPILLAFVISQACSQIEFSWPLDQITTYGTGGINDVSGLGEEVINHALTIEDGYGHIVTSFEFVLSDNTQEWGIGRYNGWYMTGGSFGPGDIYYATTDNNAAWNADWPYYTSENTIYGTMNWFNYYIGTE